MGKYTQAKRGMRVTTPLEPDTLLIEALHAREGISELFEFRLDLLAEVGTSIAFDKLLGHPAVVELEQLDGPPRYFHGVVQSFSEEGSDKNFTRYQAVLVPKVWLLTRNVQCRIFQQMTAPEILKTLFKSLDVTYNLSEQYQPHNYCVQYRESDFAFASRLMEEEGIFYYCIHTAEKHQLVVTDQAQIPDRLPGNDTFAFDRSEGGTRKDSRIWTWRKRQQLCARKFTLWDHSFQLPGQNLEAVETGMPALKAGRVTHPVPPGDPDGMEIFEYPGGYAHRFDDIGPDGAAREADVPRIFRENRRLARLRAEEETVGSLITEGTGNCARFFPGIQFTLKDHGHGDGAYRLTRVVHEGKVTSYRSGKEEPATYENRFSCIPADIPYRSARQTPRPVIGLQTATVVGPAGEESFTDKYGRVKVQFNWDRRGKRNADSSCWVRVAHGWAGKGWGIVSIPRVGQEVVVDFLEGDPDWPLVVGSVYNADQVAPFDLPAKRTVQGLKAQTHGANGDPTRYSGLGIETQTGKEHVYVHAQLDRTDSSNRSHQVRVGQNYNVNVGDFHSRIIGFRSSHPEKQWIAPPPSGGSGSGTGFWDSVAHQFSGFTLGQELSGILGSGNDNVFGQYLYSVINPIALVSSLAAPEGSIGGAFATTNYGQAMIGGAADVTYGAQIAIYRGPKFGLDGDASKYPKVLKFCVSAFVACEFAACLEMVDSEPYARSWLVAGAKLFYDCIVAAEILSVPPPAAVDGQDQVDPKVRRALIAVQITIWAIQAIGMAVAGGFGGISAAGSGGGSGLDDAPSMAVDDKSVDYMLSAPTVTITGTGSDDELPECVVQAVGPAALGFLRIQIDEVAAEITMDCGADGTITLQSGVTMEPNALVMSPEGIMVTSAELITLETLENSVEIDPEAGVTLQAAANTALVSDEGIVLSVGASSITLTEDAIILEAGGATLELSSEGIVLNGVSVSLSGDSAIEIAAPSVTVGELEIL